MQSPTNANRFMFFLATYQFSLQILVWFAFSYFDGEFVSNIPLTYLNTFFQVTGIFLPCVLYIFVVKPKLSVVFPLERISGVNIAYVVGLTLLMFPITWFLGSVTAFYSENVIGKFVASLFERNFYEVFFAVAIVPAFFEEVALRGVVLHNYRGVTIFKAALMNGIFFGMFHLAIDQLLYASVLGFVFAYFVHYTRNIFTSMLAHLMFNGIQVSLFRVGYTFQISQGMSVDDMFKEQTLDQKLLSLYVTAGILVFVLPIFIFVLRKFIKHNEARLALVDIYQVEMLDTDSELHTQNKPTPPLISLTFYGFVAIYFLIVFFFK